MTARQINGSSQGSQLPIVRQARSAADCWKILRSTWRRSTRLQVESVVPFGTVARISACQVTPHWHLTPRLPGMHRRLE